MNEAKDLMAQRDFKGASQKVDEAAPYAVCASEKDAVKRYRLAIASSLGQALSAEEKVYLESPPKVQ